MNKTVYQIAPIGYIHSCFKEKFGIPRQPLLVSAATGVIELLPPYNRAEALMGLEKVSHLWLLFIFNQSMDEKVRLKVRPPRLGGNKSLGVFATRSNFRPNNIGQSVVKLDNIIDNKLYVSGIDLLDQTPIIDIKPYVPYADNIEAAYNLIAKEAPHTINVTWSPLALEQALLHSTRLKQPIKQLIEQCLMQDPKPAYQKAPPNKYYGTKLWDIDVKWHYPSSNLIEVLIISH